MAMAGPRFFGFVIGGAWDQNAAFHSVTIGVVALEQVALEQVALGWLVDLLGLPAGTGDVLSECNARFVIVAVYANFIVDCYAN